MVHTRRLKQSSDHKREARIYWKRKRGKYLTRHVQKVLEGSVTSSSSSSSDASDSEAITVSKLSSSSNLQRKSFSRRITRRSLQPNSISTYNKVLYTSDSGDSTSSETRVLIETGRLAKASRDDDFSVPLDLVQSNVSKKHNLSDRQPRRSLAPIKEPSAHIDLVSSDENSTEEQSTVVENKGTESTSKSQLPARTIRTPDKSRLFDALELSSVTRGSSSVASSSLKNRMVTRNSLLKNQTNEKKSIKRSAFADQKVIRNHSLVDFYVKTLSTENDPSVQQITLQKVSSIGQSGLKNPTITRSTSSKKETSVKISNNSQLKSTSSKSRQPGSKDQTVTRSISSKENSSEKSSDSQVKRTPSKSGSKDQTVTRSTSSQKQTSETILNDSELESTPSQGDIRQSGSKDETVIRNSSNQKETAEKISNDSQVKSTSSISDFDVQNIQISLKRTPVKPRFIRPRQSKHTTETISPIASCSNINQTTAQKETNGKTTEDHLEIEDLLRQLEGSDDSEEEKDEQLSAKQKRRKVSSKKTSQKNKISDMSKKFSHDQENLNSKKKNQQNENSDETCSRYDKYVTNIRKQDISKSLCDNAAQCTICKKFFHSLPTLNRHKRMIHENKVDFKCQKCGKKFARLDYLKNHERLLHSENPYFTCQYCDKNFSYKHSRDNHERGHTGEKPFKCRICGAKFTRKDYYKKHRLQHDIKRAKFICDECDKPFVDKFSLQIHIQHHMKIKEAADIENSQVEVIQLFINDDWD